MYACIILQSKQVALNVKHLQTQINMSDELNMPIEEQVAYTDDNIRHLSDMEHVRLRPGMYIGKLGDGSQNDDGIYVLLKEVIDNSIDEFKMHAGKRIEIDITDHKRQRARLWSRHPSGQADGGGKRAQHRR